MQAPGDQGRGMNGSTQCEGVGSKGLSPYGKTSWPYPCVKGLPGVQYRFSILRSPRSRGLGVVVQYTASRHPTARWRAL